MKQQPKTVLLFIASFLEGHNSEIMSRNLKRPKRDKNNLEMSYSIPKDGKVVVLKYKENSH